MLDTKKLDQIIVGFESLNARLDAADRERAEHRQHVDALCQRLDELCRRADAVSAAYAGDPVRELEGRSPPFNPTPGIDSPTRH